MQYLSNVSSMYTIFGQSDGHNIIKKSKYLSFLPTTHSPTVLFCVNSLPHSTPFNQQAWIPAIEIWYGIRNSFELVFLHYTRIHTDIKYTAKYKAIILIKTTLISSPDERSYVSKSKARQLTI